MENSEAEKSFMIDFKNKQKMYFRPINIILSKLMTLVSSNDNLRP